MHVRENNLGNMSLWWGEISSDGYTCGTKWRDTYLNRVVCTRKPRQRGTGIWTGEYQGQGARVEPFVVVWIQRVVPHIVQHEGNKRRGQVEHTAVGY